MEIKYRGVNCLEIVTKHSSVLIDPFGASYGLGTLKAKSDVVLLTNQEMTEVPANAEAFVIDGPGEYEVKDVSIQGVAAQLHSDSEGLRGTMYRVAVGDISLLVTGHIVSKVSEAQVEAVGTVDIIAIPVGGHGLTLDGVAAVEVIQNFEPKIVIPTHFDDKKTTYPVPQDPLDLFTKEIGLEPEKSERFKLKAQDLPEITKVVELTRV